MTLFGFNIGDLLKVALEWVTANRRHRKEIGQAEKRGSDKAVADAVKEELKHVQDASRADDDLAPDGVPGQRDPNNHWSP